MNDPAAVALHEAAHAISATLLGVGVRHVMLLPDGGGRTELEPLPDDHTARAVKVAMVVLCAGFAAQATMTPPVLDWSL